MMPWNTCNETSRRINLVAITLCVAVCLVLPGGCGRGTEETGKPKVAGIVFQEDQFFRLVQYGMQAAADKYDVELLLANSTYSLDKEISLIDTYIVSKVDAIVISPLSMKSSIPASPRRRRGSIQGI